MSAEPTSTAGPDGEIPARLSKKEFAKKFRREAYLRVKEFRKTDPRMIAMQEELKQQRRDMYQKAKKRAKVIKAERKQAADAQVSAARVVKQQDVFTRLVPASSLKPVTKRTP